MAGYRRNGVVTISSSTPSPSPFSFPLFRNDYSMVSNLTPQASTSVTEVTCPSPSPSPSGSSSPSPTGSTSPSPTGSSSPSPTVSSSSFFDFFRNLFSPYSANALGVCTEVTLGPVKGEYTFNYTGILHPTLPPGSTAEDIMRAVCQANPSPAGCSAPTGVLGCAQATMDPFLIKLHGILHGNPGAYFLGSSFVVTEPPPPVIPLPYYPHVYPAAVSGAMQIGFTEEMWWYQLNTAQEAILSSVHPDLLAIAQDATSETQTHEYGHWSIFTSFFLMQYHDVINHPEYYIPSGTVHPTRNAHQADIDSRFVGIIGDLETAHGNAHDAFENTEAARDLHVGTIPGMGIECIGARDYTALVLVDTEPSGTGSVLGGITGEPFTLNTTLGDDSDTFWEGESITLIATPAPGDSFSQWINVGGMPSGMCPCAGSTNDTCAFITTPGTTNRCGAAFTAPSASPSSSP